MRPCWCWPGNALCCEGHCPREAASHQDLEAIGCFESTHRECQLPYQHVPMLQRSCCPAPGEETPARAGRGAAAADWLKTRAQAALRGPWRARGQGPGGLSASQCQSANQNPGRGGALAQEGVGGTYGFKLHWAGQAFPPPRPANKTLTSRAELRELQRQLPWVGMRAAGLAGDHLAGAIRAQARGWPPPGQRLSL